MQEDTAEKSRALLARLIGQTAPKTDADELAGRLLRRYGSLAPLMCSKAQDLMEMPGVTPTIAGAITLVPLLTRYTRREGAGRPVVRNAGQAGDYLRRLYIGQNFENVYLLCLERDGQVIDCPLIQRGTLDQAPFYMRHIMEAAFRTRAHAVVLSHNHPSGTKYPSGADSKSTLDTLRALSPLGVVLLDHIVVADDDAISIRKLGAVSERLFRAQSREDALLQNWLY